VVPNSRDADVSASARESTPPRATWRSDPQLLNGAYSFLNESQACFIRRTWRAWRAQRPLMAPLHSLLHSRSGVCGSVTVVLDSRFLEICPDWAVASQMVQHLQVETTSVAWRPCHTTAPSRNLKMRPRKGPHGERAAVTMHDVRRCLEHFQARLEQRSRPLQQALNVLEERAMPKVKSQSREVCRVCDLPWQQCPRHRRVPIQWCPPAVANGALTHTDWARIGWKAL
jgi:hypothetical protein